MLRQENSRAYNRILAIVPARGGSKGIPKKNIRPLAGKPLIEYTIDAARHSKYLTKIVVTTDDPEIAAIACKSSAMVIDRPTEIAQDASPVIDAIVHTLDVLKEKEQFSPDTVVLLQPTSPLRTADDIDKALELFFSGKYSSIISVCETDHSPFWSFTITDMKLKPLFEKQSSTRRQELSPTYRPNGAIYITTPEAMVNASGFMTNATGPYVMPTERSIDIDNPMDFFIAEFLISQIGKK